MPQEIHTDTKTDAQAHQKDAREFRHNKLSQELNDIVTLFYVFRELSINAV